MQLFHCALCDPLRSLRFPFCCQNRCRLRGKSVSSHKPTTVICQHEARPVMRWKRNPALPVRGWRKQAKRKERNDSGRGRHCRDHSHALTNDRKWSKLALARELNEECRMKLMWFHLMPYTELPDDFRAKNPSVWVDIHSSLFDPKRAHLMYNDFMDELEYAAEVGFDAVCVNEHHSNGYGLMPSPNLIASSLARRTTDTALCVMGNSLALYNPPTRVAEEFAMIDCISGGRLIAGFPVGTPMDTCFAYGQNPSMLRERYYEAHDLVLRAWTEQDTFAFNGRFNQQRYVNIWPRPVQKPHPPVWIA